ncbi:ThiF family adenylyltransferase [Alkalithermobacter thermoalcaliphilus]
MQYDVNDFEFEKSLRILSFLKDARTEEECKTFLYREQIPEEFFRRLIRHKMITNYEKNFVKKDEMHFKNSLYLETVVSNPDTTEKNFNKSIIIIVGCGGIGNFMSYSLGSFNPKKIILIDGDRIEKSNLNRQFMFNESDIGEYKSKVLARELKRRNSTLNVIEISQYVTENILDSLLKDLEKEDVPLGILSGDTDQALLATTRSFARYSIPFLNVGYLNDISVIGPFYIPRISACPLCNNTFSIKIDCNNDIISREVDELNKRSSAPSAFNNNALAASMATSDIIQYMDGNYQQIKSLNARFGVNNVTFETYKIDTYIDKNCEYCGCNENSSRATY